jgi:hypothetical protein
MEKSYIINANNDENEIDKLCNSLISMIIQTLQDVKKNFFCRTIKIYTKFY